MDVPGAFETLRDTVRVSQARRRFARLTGARESGLTSEVGRERIPTPAEFFAFGLAAIATGKALARVAPRH
jgi:hypothetical protein